MVTNADGKPRGKVGEVLPEGDVIPTGTKILVRLDEVEEVSAGGIVMATATERNREQIGQDVGVVELFGPMAFLEWENMGDTPEERAATFGIKIGDKVLFDRYEGKAPRVLGYENHRLINGICIHGKVE
jgi:co-chaperonin GroES (HSP10)